MLTRRTIIGGAAALLSVAAAATPVFAQDKPLVIRWGYALPPPMHVAGIFTLKPDILKHYGKSYTIETKFLRSTPLVISGFASNEVDVANLGASGIALGALNAGMTDLKLIIDEAEDGFNGQFASEMRVRKDSGINSVSDLKGKVVGTIALGSSADLVTRLTLRKYGLELNRDFTYLETPFPTMKPMVLEKKISAGWFVQPFASDPELIEQTKVLFTSESVFGPVMLNFLTARGGFIEKNRAAMVDFTEDFLRVARAYYDPKNRDESIKIASDQSKIPEEVLRRYIFTNRDSYRNLDGLADLNALQTNFAAMKDLGLVRQELNANDHADLSLVKEAAARIKP